ncbi:cupin domain-containing protein [Candidatus Brocadia pituitae]|nr:cupin domain-containing protein [Candidatus Brocadia pituitae]
MIIQKTGIPRLLISLLPATFLGCTTVKYYPVNFIESLQHPTKFPEVFSSNVQNIEEIASKNPLGEDEEVKITEVGKNKNSSMHLIQVRENGEFHPHYHKRHDEVIYVKKGSGIATLDGTRYLVKSGSILQIPSKTIHKFINTGGEPFMAVSIFSPPFDGRDEKSIREKKKTARGGKEEKRLAVKKPEKLPEQNQISPQKDIDEEAIQNAVADTQEVAENKHKESPPEVLSSAKDELPESSHKISKIEKKKRSKDISTPEMPSIDIKDLHEKLSKLLELKEEGTISAVEYEEKKDALMKGNDIGTLPETKGYAKKKIRLEDEDVSQQPENLESTIKGFADEALDSMVGPPIVPDEESPSVQGHSAQEQELSPDDKLKLLEEMRHEGLISDEDFESKGKELLTPPKAEPKAEIPGNISPDERAAELKELYDQQLITEDDYKQKLEEITSLQTQNDSSAISSHAEKTDLMPSESTTENEKVKDLKELYDDGLITEEDYTFKLKELAGTEMNEPSPTTSSEKGLEDDKLAELKELKEEGLISDEDYEFKKAQLLGN